MKQIKMIRPRVMNDTAENLGAAVRSREISGESWIVRSFEEKFAGWVGTKYAVAVSNGWAALFLSCWVLARGKKILLPDITMIACANAAKLAGCKLIVHDVNENGLLPDVCEGEWPDIVMPVHLFGRPQGNKTYMNPSIEDCAEAHGAMVGEKKVGSIGTVGCFSFYANKTLTTGEGGMITTNDEGLAEEFRSLRSHAFGKENKYQHEQMGFNFRMTAMSAVMGVSHLEVIDDLIAERNAYADYYYARLGANVRIKHESGIAPSWWFTPYFAQDREGLKKHLASARIETRDCFVPLHRLPFLEIKGEFPNADHFADHLLLLPMPDTIMDAKRICDAIESYGVSLNGKSS